MVLELQKVLPVLRAVPLHQEASQRQNRPVVEIIILVVPGPDGGALWPRRVQGLAGLAAHRVAAALAWERVGNGLKMKLLLTNLAMSRQQSLSTASHALALMMVAKK